MHSGAVGERARQTSERTGVARMVHRGRRQVPHGFFVPQFVGRRFLQDRKAGHPQPTPDGGRVCVSLFAHPSKGRAQRVGATSETTGDPLRHPFEQEVHGSQVSGRIGEGGERGLGDPLEGDRVGEASGVDQGCDGLEVALPRAVVVEAFEPSGSIEQCRRCVGDPRGTRLAGSAAYEVHLGS